jgi:hypothetical protein
MSSKTNILKGRKLPKDGRLDATVSRKMDKLSKGKLIKK